MEVYPDCSTTSPAHNMGNGQAPLGAAKEVVVDGKNRAPAGSRYVLSPVIYMVPFIAGGAGFWPSTVLARHTHLRIKTSTFWPILSEWLVSVSSQPRDNFTRNVQEPWSKATAKTVTRLHWALAALPFLGRCLTAISLDQWPWLRGWSGSPRLRDSRNTIRKHEKMWKPSSERHHVSETKMPTTRSVLDHSMIFPQKFTKFDFPPKFHMVQQFLAFSCNSPTSLNLKGSTHGNPHDSWPTMTNINCIKCWTVWSNWNPRCAAVRSCRTSQWWQGAIWLDLPMITVSFKCWEVYFPETHETSEKILFKDFTHLQK